MVSILLIDDERDWLTSFKRTLAQHSVTDAERIHLAENEESAFSILQKTEVDIIFLDLMLGRVSGKDVLTKIKNRFPATVVIIMSGINDIHTALECGKLGAADYIVKTSLVEEVIANIRRIVKICMLEKENNALRSGIFAPSDDFPEYSGYITVHPHMKIVFKYLNAISASLYPLLITGESGVGKGVLAKAFARHSRPKKPFISVNVGGLDSQMFSDAIFGHRKGAFTGADSSRTGAVQQAEDGILFLDEIGELSSASQLKLLYLTQDGEYSPLGSDQVYRSKAKFIFATNQNLEEKCQSGEFRKDMYYRLNTHRVHIPPLRERREDIPVLFRHFISEAAAEFSKDEPDIDDNIIDILRDYPFPGNIRQLRSICYDLLARYDDRLTAAAVKRYLSNAGPVKSLSQETMPNAEIHSFDNNLPTVNAVVADLLEKAMRLCGGNQTKAAAMIGLSQSTISRYLRKNRGG